MRAGLLGLLLAGCVAPSLDEPWRIDRLRVLAVVAQPAEIAPGEEVTLEVKWASPDDALTPSFAWSACEAPAPFGSATTITSSCWDSLATQARTSERQLTLRVPADACARFGPEGAAGSRPRDPDSSGGTYWPVAIAADDQTSFAAVRVTCRPGSVPLEVAQGWFAAWKPNENPRLEVTPSAPFDALRAGESVELVADWSLTPEEAYPLALPGSSQLDFARERYDVSWFVTGEASLEHARTGSRVRVQLPTIPGQARLWAVLRDGRGGVSTWTALLAWH